MRSKRLALIVVVQKVAMINSWKAQWPRLKRWWKREKRDNRGDERERLEKRGQEFHNNLFPFN